MNGTLLKKDNEQNAQRDEGRSLGYRVAKNLSGKTNKGEI